MDEKMSLFKRMVRAGRRTYFFDVKEAKNSKKFMIISESMPSGDGKFKRSSLMIFQEDMESFFHALSEAKGLF